MRGDISRRSDTYISLGPWICAEKRASPTAFNDTSAGGPTATYWMVFAASRFRGPTLFVDSAGARYLAIGRLGRSRLPPHEISGFVRHIQRVSIIRIAVTVSARTLRGRGKGAQYRAPLKVWAGERCFKQPRNLEADIPIQSKSDVRTTA
jgi:hypothetical protein